ncbi:type IV pilin protein [Methylobacter sp. S3L5C]|uniref:type IV pilin protein n=1 Tax=Methylobacter sp. S3L5C TaxID=2839024 RepID=UPI001FAB4D32|nr:type IV pilin protein [Methylobacter sp. S3L5C]UOA07563.1 type IV pilin protein [Methylobacter sp. S3L5C]
MKKSQPGFTLIELMITVVIVGILAGIAIPSYQASVMKSRRADAQGALLGFENAMERYFTVNNSYLGAAGTVGSHADTGSPRIYSITSPVDGGTAFYNLTINAATASSYTLSAEPTGVQSSDKCGTLTLTHTGVKGFTGTGVTAADCW